MRIALSRATAAFEVGRSSSASAIQPRKRPSYSTPTDGLAFGTASLSRKAGEPSRAGFPRNVPCTPLPPTRAEILRPAAASPR